MSGFVYIWRDRKHNRYYVGSHWGRQDDGYICSSQWMKRAYLRRPQDFKRRILKIVENSRKDLLREETRWLKMIKDYEVGKRYYNLKNGETNHWYADEVSRMSISEKIAASPKRSKRIGDALRGRKKTDEHKRKIAETLHGRKLTEEHKANIKKNHKRDYSDPVFREKMRKAALSRSPETRAKISANSKRLHSEGRVGRRGSYREEMYLKYVSQSTL